MVLGRAGRDYCKRIGFWKFCPKFFWLGYFSPFKLWNILYQTKDKHLNCCNIYNTNLFRIKESCIVEILKLFDECEIATEYI